MTSPLDPSQSRARPDAIRRPRRLRRTPALRGLVRETILTPACLVQPIFLTEGVGVARAIDSLPGQNLYSIDEAGVFMARSAEVGIAAFALFPKVEAARKSPDAEEAVNPDNLACRTLRQLKREHPDACLIADVALDPYSSFGHDGIVRDGQIANDASVEVLARMAVFLAEAGADIVAPSDMMDGRIAAIRRSLDHAGATDAIILSYAAKFASAFYGPFRAALDSAPNSGAGVTPASSHYATNVSCAAPLDKTTYQLDPANAREALLEAALDEAEAADILMVKPALPYLDIIARLRERTLLPIAAYHTSGEYAMLEAAAAQGLLDGPACLHESLTAIVRAGADIIISYGAVQWAARQAHKR